ncbi:MAG: 16S rRNA processing protein RimM [Clostridia bacterium]|nr:16S rRNA processing protein RimM [Clostridia bacterium]
MSTVEVGKIVKPQGIKGEVKVQCFVDNPQGFAHLGKITVEGRPYRILRARSVGADVYLTLEGVSDRNAAEALRDSILTVDRKEAEGLKTGEYFVQDLIGLAVTDGERDYGVISDVLQYGAADVLVLDGGKTMVPYLKRLVLRVDLEGGRMEVDAKVWQEVVCEN